MKRIPLILAALCLQTFAAGRMNVLLIISDDMRNELGCYASQLARTPNLDRLAATGIKFDRAYCQFPLCGPSRSSMLTGRHPATVGVLGNRTWSGDAHPEIVSLPKHFKNNGYASIRVGKIFHGGIDDTEAWSIDGQPRTLAGVPKDQLAPAPRKKAPVDPDDVVEVTPEVPHRKSGQWIVLKGKGEEHADYRAADRAINHLRQYKDQQFFTNELTNLANDPKYARVVAKLSPLVKAYAKGHLPPAAETK